MSAIQGQVKGTEVHIQFSSVNQESIWARVCRNKKASPVLMVVHGVVVKIPSMA